MDDFVCRDAVGVVPCQELGDGEGGELSERGDGGVVDRHC